MTDALLLSILIGPKSEDANSQLYEKSKSRNNSSRRNPRLAVTRIDKYNIDSDVDENDEEIDIEMCQNSVNRESLENDDQDDEHEEGAQEGEEDDEQSDRDERVSNSTSSRRQVIPTEARENMRKSREMVDSGLNQYVSICKDQF